MQALAAFLIWLALIATQAVAPTLHGPVMALYVDGDRLLIGQGDILIDALITPGDVQITRSVELHRHAIRAITTIKGAALILSEDGLSALDAADNVTDFAPGGGQRLIARGSRVYAAALQAGVRIYSLDGRKLKPLGQIDTQGPAEDIATDGANWLWVAEGDQGIRLYDLTNPGKPAVLYWSADLKPARLVRVNGARLFVGYANRLAVLDTTAIKAPRLLGEATLGAERAFAGDMLVDHASLLVGRVDASGSDVIRFDMTNPKAIKELARIGESGAGERLALHGSDVFSGSERTGLQRVGSSGGALSLVAAWDAGSDSTPCTDLTPVNPQPANLSEPARAEPMTLTWGAQCPAARYEVWIDGQRMGVVDRPEFSFTPRGDAIQWQIIALTGSARAEGPRWSFETPREGYLETPLPPPITTVLYTPPRPSISLQTPAAVIAATCVALLIGLALIVAGAVAISAWFERRRAY